MADLLPQLHEQARRVAGGRVSVLLRLDTRTGTLQAVSASGLTVDRDPWLGDDAGQAAAARVWKEAAPRAVDNLPLLFARLDSRGAILVPLLSRHAPLGLLVIGVDGGRRAPEPQAELAALGDLLAVALDCARLQREADLQRDIAVLVSDITRAVSSSLHLHASLGIFCGRAAPLFGARSVAIWLHERRARLLELAASSDASELAAAAPIRADDAAVPTATAMRQTRAQVVRDPVSGAAEVLVPLRGGRRALGTLAVRGVHAGPGDEIDLLDRLEEVARQLSTAIENVLLLEDVLRSRRELESTFNSMADLVVVCDSQLRITHANRAFAARTAFRAADLQGRSLREFFDTELIAWVDRLGPIGEPPPYESRELQDVVLGGTFLFTLSALGGREDERVGTVVVARDVTEQAQLEAERAELRDRLAQTEKLAALGQFVAGIAHELNNPLQGVLGHVELLLQEPTAVPAGFKRDLKLVLREADRAAKIVHDLLVFAGSRRITRRRLNVNHIVTRVLSLRAQACAAAGIELATELAPKLTRVSGDALLLQQALINIVVNAEQALASRPAPRRIEVRTRTLGRKGVEIRIADNGPGIAADALPRLFEPFFTTKEVGKGTGLGLAIAYGIVQEHEGRLSVANGAAGGAVFTLELPAGR
jgi:PAS domain S-box-containing protein